ncbi:MAG: hypothetical protein ABDH28_01375 [Brevinematia bacterium]
MLNKLFRLIPVIVCALILSTIRTYGVPPFLKNENAIISSKEKITLSIELQNFSRWLPDLSDYNILKISFKGVYSPNNYVELGFEFPYLKILEANDNGVIGDVRLFSKFLTFNETFSFIDTFLFQNALTLQLSLATGVKKEDSYRNIGLQKGLYFPLSSGYTDIEIGNALTLVGNIFALSLYLSFISISSKIEPPLAFNIENDNLIIGSTFEVFCYYSKHITIKLFSETIYYLPISDKSKYVNALITGGGLWVKVLEALIFNLGYYQNFSPPIDIERTTSWILSGSIGLRL